MARIKGLAVTNLQGRLGNMVFRNRGGENIVSQRPASVKNPRSSGQQLQRMIMSTVVQAYSGLKFITDHSFEGRTYGAKNMERFMKLNLDKLRGAGTTGRYIARGNASVAPFDFVVSEGSLPSVLTDGSPSSDSFFGNELETGVSSEDITLQEFIKAVGMEPGDQISFVLIGCDNDESFPVAGGSQITEVRKIYARLTLKASYSTDELAQTLFDGGLLRKTLFDEIVYDAGFGFNVSQNDRRLVILGNFAVATIGYAVILSRKDGQTWQRSTQSICPMIAGNINYEVANVLPTYDPTSPYYLNNASV